MRATLAHDVEVVRLLLDKGASPNSNAMGITPFLAAAGLGPNSRGGGAGGLLPNIEIMNLLIQHGANINAQVTGTKTYSMRISRAPSPNEGMSALHGAVQARKADLVRFLIEKGVKTDLLDSNGRKAIDLLSAVATDRAGNRAGSGAGNAESIAEIRKLLQDGATGSR